MAATSVREVTGEGAVVETGVAVAVTGVMVVAVEVDPGVEAVVQATEALAAPKSLRQALGRPPRVTSTVGNCPSLPQ